MSLSLYRKYRPNVFADVVGQEHVEKTLVNAVTEGTVAHAYLFCGPRGTGKTTTARLLAKALLCERGPAAEPDGTCPQCTEIAQGNHPDVYELDAASRTGVENVRDEIISRVQFSPTRGRYKIYIIDEVHMLSTAAFNALLKTLEEPPAHVVFVLCTTDPHKVPETIQSRCQRFDFHRLSIDEIVSYLQRICEGEQFQVEPEALEYIAAKSAGGMRDATTALEQLAVFTSGSITLHAAKGLFGQMDTSGLFEIAGLIAARDVAGCFEWLHQLVGTGADLTQFSRDLASHMRDLYVTALTGGEGGIVACPPSELPKYQQQARAFGGAERLSRAMTTCGELVNELRNSSDARLSVEIALTKLTRAQSELTVESMAERIEALEQGMPAQPAVSFAPQVQQAAVPEEPQWEAVQAEPQRAAQSEPQPQPEPQRESIPLAQAAKLQKEREEAERDAALDAQQAREQAAAKREAEEQARREAERAAAQQAADEAAEQAAANRAAQETAARYSTMSPARLLAALLTEVKRNDMATGALLNGVVLEEAENGYNLTFPADAGFAMKVASSGDARKLIVKALETVVGHEVQCNFRLEKKAVAATRAVEPSIDETRSAYQAEQASRLSASTDYDDGYYAAQEADAAYYDSGYDAGYDAGYDGGYGMSQAAEDMFSSEPDFDAPANVRKAPVDDETAADLANVLSAFGAGVKVQEIDPDQ